MSSDPPRIGSYRASSLLLSDAVYQLLRGCVYGGIWGMVTPFHAPGSVGAIAEAKTGIFKAARPFSSIASIGHNAAMFGAIMGVQRFSCKSLEIVRQQQDFFNEIFGFGVTYKYYTYFLGSSEERLIKHNRIFGGVFVGAILYGHFLG